MDEVIAKCGAWIFDDLLIRPTVLLIGAALVRHEAEEEWRRVRRR
jgi:hypothetical protein